MKRGRPGKRAGTVQGKIKMAKAMGSFYAARASQRPRPGISSASVFQNVSRQPELKFLDVTTAGTFTVATATANTPVLINGCAQGTDANQHIGRQTTMKSLYWLWEGFLATTTIGQTSCRLVIVYDKEAEGAAPTVAAGMQTDIFNMDSIVAQNNLNNRDRFVILVDEVVECLGASGPSAFMRKGYRKVQLPCVFNAGAGATVAAINTGSVYAIVWGGFPLAVANATYNLQTRIRFTDA